MLTGLGFGLHALSFTAVPLAMVAVAVWTLGEILARGDVPLGGGGPGPAASCAAATRARST